MYDVPRPAPADMPEYLESVSSSGFVKSKSRDEPITVGLVEGPETVLIGTGYGASAADLLAFLEPFDDLDVIVVEHGDADHYDGVPPLLERYDAEVAIPRQDAHHLADVGVSADVELGHDEVRWGLRTVHLPGHTPGNMAYLHEDSGVLFAGDTFVGTDSYLVAEGDWSGALAIPADVTNDDPEATRTSIATLADYDFEVIVNTHGSHVLEDAHAELETLLDDLGLT